MDLKTIGQPSVIVGSTLKDIRNSANAMGIQDYCTAPYMMRCIVAPKMKDKPALGGIVGVFQGNSKRSKLCFAKDKVSQPLSGVEGEEDLRTAFVEELAHDMIGEEINEELSTSSLF